MSKWITPDIKTEKRDLTKELDAAFQADAKYAPQTYGLEEKYGPLYNRINVSNLAEGALGYTGKDGAHVPGQLELARSGTTLQRSQDISDVETYGGRAVDAQLDANPYLKRSLGLLMDRTQDTPILQTLNHQAEDALAQGGKLSAEDIRSLNEQSRDSYASRGLLNSDQSAAAELLSRDAASRSRLQQSQSFAGAVQGLNQAQNAFVGNVAQLSASSIAEPFQAVLGRSGVTVGQLQPTNGTRAFAPFDAQNYVSDLYTYNANAQNARNIALANAQANTRSSIATVASSFSDERLKENIVHVGTSPAGIPMVEFNYNLTARKTYGLRMRDRWRGVLAQEIEKIKPAAVWTDSRGFKIVDYDLLDVKMEKVTPTAAAA